MTLNECLGYLITEANNFNAGSAWGVSTYAMLIHETIARIYEKKTGNKYPGDTNRPFESKPLNEFIEITKQQNKLYEEEHKKTTVIMDAMLTILSMDM